MKTIIVSDITEDNKSVIPYGLNIGKYTESVVEILHFIDPTIQQGVSSPYSDSQTFSPAEKLAHEQLLNREKYWAEMEIHKLLSREASVLNYPLRIHEDIDVKDSSEGISQILAEEPGSIVVTGTNPSRAMFSNLSELLQIARNNKTMVWVVPSNHPFEQPKEGIMVTDFSHENYNEYDRIFKLLKPFNPLIYACTIVNEVADDGLEVKIAQWMELVKPLENSSCIYKTGIMKGNVQSRPLIEYIGLYNPDLIVLPLNKRDSITDIPVSENGLRHFIESINTPVLFY